jgi:hypothetical protein
MVTKKKTTSKSKRKTSIKEPAMKSFKMAKKDVPFLTTTVTKQTIYWAILMLTILGLEVWILYAQLNVIDATNNLLG